MKTSNLVRPCCVSSICQNLLNYISKYKDVPEQIQTLWGQSIKTLGSIKSSLMKIGKQNKQSIILSIIILDNEGKCVNKKLIYNILPMKARSSNYDFLHKCILLRKNLNNNYSKILCINNDNNKRNRYLYYVF